MSKKNYLWVLAVLILSIFACSSLTPEGERVRITVNTQATAGCNFLGKVKGKYDNDLRNEAAKLGANLVWNETEAMHDTGPRIWQHGEAYRCPDNPSQPEKGGSR
jgi:hypothetical protein